MRLKVQYWVKYCETVHTCRPFSRSDSAPPEHILVIVAVNFNGGVALDALRAPPEGSIPDKTFLRSHCSNTVEGVERLCQWLAASQPS
jgi:hypothetical protein